LTIHVDTKERKKSASRIRSRRYYIRHKKEILDRQKRKPVSTARKKAKQRWERSLRGRSYRAQQRYKRRSLNKNLTELDIFVLREAYKLAKLREANSTIKWNVDHIIAVSRGGTNRYDNIQVVPEIWNKRKFNKHSKIFFGCN